MSAALFACPLCGHRFNAAEHAACRACPLHGACSLVCCPACGHTTIDAERSRLARWFASLRPRPAQRAAALSTTEGCTLAEVPPGRRARVLEMGGLPLGQRERLQAYGLAPGRWLSVLQHSPVTVVQVDHTELAFERELAAKVRVEL
jgi:Fe2+ transport system protein FeoA